MNDEYKSQDGKTRVLDNRTRQTFLRGTWYNTNDIRNFYLQKKLKNYN